MCAIQSNWDRRKIREQVTLQLKTYFYAVIKRGMLYADKYTYFYRSIFLVAFGLRCC